MCLICDHVLSIGTRNSITNNPRVERLVEEGFGSCRKRQVVVVFGDADYDDDDSN